MGSNCKSYGGGGKSCGCNKRVKKAQRVPQRGPGVAELEKILSDQKQDHMKPLYAAATTTTVLNGPPLYNQPHYHLPRPLPESHFFHFGASGNLYVRPWRSDGAMKSDSINDSGLSFTQMMMMGEPHPQDSKPNTTLVYQTNSQMMSNSYPSTDAPRFNHFNKHSSPQRIYNKCPPVYPEEDTYAMKKAGGEMPSHPHPVYAQQLGQTIIENGRAIAEHEKTMLRNILTLRPPSPTKGSSTPRLHPIFVESDSSEEQCKDRKPEKSCDKSHQSQIFGFNLADKSISLDDTKLSLHHNAARAEELSLDLTLKL